MIFGSKVKSGTGSSHWPSQRENIYLTIVCDERHDLHYFIEHCFIEASFGLIAMPQLNCTQCRNVCTPFIPMCSCSSLAPRHWLRRRFNLRHSQLILFGQFSIQLLDISLGLFRQYIYWRHWSIVRLLFHLPYALYSKTKVIRSASSGGSPGLVVMGDDSCSTGRGFEFQHRILNGHFVTLIYCKIVLFEKTEKTKNKRKRGLVWPFLKKKNSFWKALNEQK